MSEADGTVDALIIGCGYTGRRLARALVGEGLRVFGTVSSPDSLAALGDLPAGVLDLDRPQDHASLAELPWAAHIYWLAPPPRAGLDDPRLRRFLEALPASRSPHRLIYVSTTGVYGDAGGDWVDERVAPRPSDDRGERRLSAELTLLGIAEARGLEQVVLRVAGIYGPGRLGQDRIAQGRPVLRDDESPWTNRIHVDDLVTCLRAAAERGEDGEVYNVCDDQPAPSAAFQRAVAAAAGLDPPPEIGREEAEASFSAMRLSFLRDDKRVSNEKIKERLGVELRYPTFAQGIEASLREEPGAGS